METALQIDSLGEDDKVGKIDIHTLGIHHLGADNSQVAVRHFQNLSIANQYGAILQPSLRGKDLAIYYLCQHKSKQFIRSFH